MDNVILQLFLGLFSGIIGAFLGGYYTLKAAEKSFEFNLRVQKEQEKEQIEALISSLETELYCLKNLYDEEFGNKLDSIEKNEALSYEYSITQDYFIIYNNNAHLIGKIRDESLRNSIVKTYILGKQFIEIAKLYKELGCKYESYIYHYKTDVPKDAILASKGALTMDIFTEYKAQETYREQFLTPTYSELISFTQETLKPTHKDLIKQFKEIFKAFKNYKSSKSSEELRINITKSKNWYSFLYKEYDLLNLLSTVKHFIIS